MGQAQAPDISNACTLAARVFFLKSQWPYASSNSYVVLKQTLAQVYFLYQEVREHPGGPRERHRRAHRLVDWWLAALPHVDLWLCFSGCLPRCGGAQGIPFKTMRHPSQTDVNQSTSANLLGRNATARSWDLIVLGGIIVLVCEGGAAHSVQRWGCLAKQTSCIFLRVSWLVCSPTRWAVCRACVAHSSNHPCVGPGAGVCRRTGPSPQPRPKSSRPSKSLFSSWLLVQEAPENPNVKKTLADGLTIDIYHQNLPVDVCGYLRDFFNAFHGGVGQTFLEIVQHVEPTDASWKVFAHANGIPLSKGARGEDATRRHLEKYLASKHADTYPTCDLFESARSLFNSMSRMKVFDEFVKFVGDTCDFLASGLSHKDAVKVLHFWSTQVVKLLVGNSFSLAEARMVFMQGLRLMIPTDSDHVGDSSGCSGEWVIQKGGPESEAIIKLVLTNMSDSKVYQDAKAIEAGLEPPSKKAKVTSTEKSEKKKVSPFSQDLSTLSMKVGQGKDKSRAVYWVDDVKRMLTHALNDARTAFGEMDPERMRKAEESWGPGSANQAKRSAVCFFGFRSAPHWLGTRPWANGHRHWRRRTPGAPLCFEPYSTPTSLEYASRTSREEFGAKWCETADSWRCSEISSGLGSGLWSPGLCSNSRRLFVICYSHVRLPKELVWHACLKFAFTGSVTIKDKTYTAWSKLREVLGKQIASNLSPGELKASSSADTGADAAVALVTALSEATGKQVTPTKLPARSLALQKSVQLTEQDISESIALNADRLKEFIAANPVDKKVRNHKTYNEFQTQLEMVATEFKDAKLKEGDKLSDKNPVTFADVFGIIGKSLGQDFALTLVEVISELIEYTTQQGGYPVDIAGSLLKSKEVAEKFGHLRSHYVLFSLIELFGEDGALHGFSPPGMSEIVKTFRPWGGEKCLQLLTLFGQWDLPLKPVNIDEWSAAWAERFGVLATPKDQAISFGSVYNSMVAHANRGSNFKGKLSTDDAALELEIFSDMPSGVGRAVHSPQFTAQGHGPRHPIQQLVSDTRPIHPGHSSPMCSCSVGAFATYVLHSTHRQGSKSIQSNDVGRS